MMALDKKSRDWHYPIYSLDVQNIIIGTKIFLEEKKQENDAAVIHEAIDQGFKNVEGWSQITAGGIDWKKRFRYNEIFVGCLGVEVQVSARSDSIIGDIVYLRNSLQQGEIDAGVIIVPSDTLQLYLLDRTPNFRDMIHYIEHEFPEAQNLPLIVIAIEHDGPGALLSKQKRAR